MARRIRVIGALPSARLPYRRGQGAAFEGLDASRRFVLADTQRDDEKPVRPLSPARSDIGKGVISVRASVQPTRLRG